MNQNFKLIIVIEIFLFILLGFWFVYEYSKNTRNQRVFSVTVEEKEIAVPNVAEIKIGLITEGSDLIRVQEENTNKFNRIINLLKDKKINERDIKTENYSITPKYRYDKVNEIVGYTVSQNILVKIRDLKKIGEILDAAVKNGANNVYGPNFTVDDEKIYLEKARERAIREAKEKARKIAKEAGFRLGKIIGFTEAPIYPATYQSSIGMGGEVFNKNLSQIEPGSQEIRIMVSLTYEIR